MTTPRLDERSKDLRRVIVRTLQQARRGHVGAAFSLIEIFRVLYDDVLRFNPQDPKGKGASFAENNMKWHHKNKVTDQEVEALLAAIGEA